MYTSDKVAQRIKDVAKEQNVVLKTMIDSCGLNKNVLSSMMSGGSMPKSENLAKIADALDCSVDYLLGRTNNPNAHKSVGATVLSKQEQEMIDSFRDLNDDGQGRLVEYMDEFLLINVKFTQKNSSVSDKEA